MNWIILSLLMFASSVVLYLFVRYSSLEKNSPHFNNLSMFLVPFFILFPLGLITHQNFFVSLPQLLIIIFISLFFSYLGNKFSVISIDYAPNPGYSLTLSKSYVVLTTLVSVFLFHSQLSLVKILGIILIVVFSAIIMIGNSQSKKKSNKLWLPLSLGAFVCWGLLSLSSKYIFNQGISPVIFLSYVQCIVSVVILFEMKMAKVSYSIMKHNLITFLCIGIFSALFNVFMMEAIKVAPNVGYVNGMNAASISAVTVLAIALFKDELSFKKFMGVLGVTIGLLLLVI